uniref:Uncharacterized protein n=1 Tax=Arundo donax TaxID=35708 RepID=A0A0A9AJG4_ARUDO
MIATVAECIYQFVTTCILIFTFCLIE